MDDVLRTLEEEDESVSLDQDDKITLPLILSYADDLIILGPCIIVIDRIVKRLIDLLSTVGLQINTTKTKLAIRDPCGDTVNDLQPICLGGVPIQPTKEIKYLGTYITSSHNRRATIKTRCDKAVRNSKILTRFIKDKKK